MADTVTDQRQAAVSTQSGPEGSTSDAMANKAYIEIPRAGEELTILFGSTPCQLFDVVDEKINAALRDEVSKMPVFAGDGPSSCNSERVSLGGVGGGGLRPPSPDEKLLSWLFGVYSINLDLAETYAGRNIFALPIGTGPKRREEIVRAYLAAGSGSGGGVKPGTGKENSTNANPNDDTNDTPTSSGAISATTRSIGGGGGGGGGGAEAENKTDVKDLLPPSKEDIPNLDQTGAIDEETADLRQLLRRARRTRSDLRSILAQMKESHGLATSAKRTIDESLVGGKEDHQAIHGSVVTAVAAREKLSTLVEDGKDLIKKLEEEKEGRGGDDITEDVVDTAAAAAAAAWMNGAAPLSIEEDMERRKKVMRTGEKSALSKLLKER